MNIYDEMAKHYDLIYNDAYDAEFYLREARDANGPVLEVACGTGRILLRLLSAGIDATGLDSSKGMISALKKKAKSAGLKPKTVIADMRDFSLKKRFKLIIIPYRSILHLNNADKEIALKNMASHLDDGGRLIVHTYNLAPEHLQMEGRLHPLDFEESATPEGRGYIVNWFMEYNPKENSGKYKIDLQFKDEPKNSHEFTMKLFFIGNDEMEAMLRSCGFSTTRLYCGFDYSVFDERCREVLWIVGK